MAASKENKNAVGNSGGKSLQDRQRAARVRRLGLGEIEKVLKAGREDPLYGPILTRLAGTLLPRLNAGRDDDERLIPVEGVEIITKK